MLRMKLLFTEHNPQSYIEKYDKEAKHLRRVSLQAKKILHKATATYTISKVKRP